MTSVGGCGCDGEENPEENPEDELVVDKDLLLYIQIHKCLVKCVHFFFQIHLYIVSFFLKNIRHIVISYLMYEI